MCWNLFIISLLFFPWVEMTRYHVLVRLRWNCSGLGTESSNKLWLSVYFRFKHLVINTSKKPYKTFIVVWGTIGIVYMGNFIWEGSKKGYPPGLFPWLTCHSERPETAAMALLWSLCWPQGQTSSCLFLPPGLIVVRAKIHDLIRPDTVGKF